MSRAFVKEQDGNLAEDDGPARPQSSHPNDVTAGGLAMLRARQQELLDKHGELSARSSDDPLLQQQLQQISRDLAFVTGRLERAIPVDPATQPQGEIRFGAVVEVSDEENKLRRFAIVGEDEADVAAGRVSWISPLAQAMKGAQLGDRVVWHRPAGDSGLTIVSIHYPGTEKD